MIQNAESMWGNPDDAGVGLNVEFYHNRHPEHKGKEMIRLSSLVDKYSVFEAEVSPVWINRFPKEYYAFQNDQKDIEGQTSLSELRDLTQGDREYLSYRGIKSLSLIHI